MRKDAEIIFGISERVLSIKGFYLNTDMQYNMDASEPK